MAYKESVWESISKNIAPVIRKLTDISIKLVGLPTSVIRIVEIIDDVNDDGFGDMIGDTTYHYEASIIENVILQLPFNEVESFPSKDTTDQSTEALTIEGFLPIIMSIPFEGNRNSVPIELDENDLIIFMMYDSKGNKIPMIFQSPKITSGFFGRYEVVRKYELTLFRGVLEDGIQEIVDDYNTYLGVPEILSTSPLNNAVNIPVDADIVIDFNITMDTDSTESAITIIPNPLVAYVNDWDITSGELSLVSGSLASGTLYNIAISTDAKGEGLLPLVSDYNFGFTTV